VTVLLSVGSLNNAVYRLAVLMASMFFQGAQRNGLVYVTVTVTEALVLRLLLEDRGRIT